jgi:hypothetical protein
MPRPIPRHHKDGIEPDLPVTIAGPAGKPIVGGSRDPPRLMWRQRCLGLDHRASSLHLDKGNPARSAEADGDEINLPERRPVSTCDGSISLGQKQRCRDYFRKRAASQPKSPLLGTAPQKSPAFNLSPTS